MPLTPGTRFGPYEILAPLGSGGMGDVYRAHDGRLDRQIALKVLRESVTSDPGQAARFEREAKLLASINHPRIASIYGIEEGQGVRALVLELVDGPTLAERIAAAPLSFSDIVDIGCQICEALEAAHDRGVVHRDLKPANIKVRHDGTVKILDFGIAKMLQGGDTGNPVSALTTVSGETGAGAILGTVSYMAPEQARGKAVDKRADIWAFGCVLFEMLTRKRVFEGEDASETLAKVLTQEPDWSALPPGNPPAVTRLLRRCLTKDPRNRLHDAGDVRLDLEEAVNGPAVETPARPARSRWWSAAGWVGAFALGATLAALAVSLSRDSEPVSVAPLQRLELSLPEGMEVATSTIAVSPDGTQIVFPASVGGARKLYVRAIDQLDLRPIAGTENALNPFFSPDGGSVGFFSLAGRDSALNKVDLRGGPVVKVAAAPIPPGGSWADDGTIIFATNPGDGVNAQLMRTAAGGGVSVPILKPDPTKQEVTYAWPDVLPGSRALLFSIASNRTSNTDRWHIAALSLETGEYHTVIGRGFSARYLPSGHLLYLSGSTLMAAPFDVERLIVTGPPVGVVQGIHVSQTGSAEPMFGVSNAGVLVYGSAMSVTTAQRSLVWVDRQGREEPVPAPARAYQTVRLSHDGTRAALDIREGESDIWTWDFGRRVLSRVTVDPGVDQSPVWTPDGRHLIFGSDRGGTLNLYSQAADGSGEAVHLTDSQIPQGVEAVAPDGRTLVLRQSMPGTALFLLSLENRQVSALLDSSFAIGHADISPDGRWMAYRSNESGEDQIYVRPFPDVNAGRWQVSIDGGTRPRWSPAGGELFYLSESGGSFRMMSVPVETAREFSAGRPRALFDGAFVVASLNDRSYDVSPDGRRFLMLKEPTRAATSSPPLIVFQNWLQRVGMDGAGNR